jgi:hypothetical protein
MTLTAHHRSALFFLMAALAAIMVGGYQVEVSRIVAAVAFGALAVLGGFVFQKLPVFINMVADAAVELRHFIMIFVVKNGGGTNAACKSAVIDLRNVFLGNRNTADNRYQSNQDRGQVKNSKTSSHFFISLPPRGDFKSQI